jgi:hypothetical protein
MTPVNTLTFAYAAYCARFRDLFPRCPVPTFDDWLDERAETASRRRAEAYMQALGMLDNLIAFAEGEVEK